MSLVNPFLGVGDPELDRLIETYEDARRTTQGLRVAYAKLAQALQRRGSSYVKGDFIYGCDGVDLWRTPLSSVRDNVRSVGRPVRPTRNERIAQRYSELRICRKPNAGRRLFAGSLRGVDYDRDSS